MRTKMAGNARYYEITGGNKLTGEIVLSGAKNAGSKQLVASLLTTETCFFSNMPRIKEIDTVLKILTEVGSKFEWLDRRRVLFIRTSRISNTRVSQEFQSYNRIPILMLGPLLHRTGNAIVPIPGGCKIGSRPVNFHIAALEKMGAKVSSTDFEYRVQTAGLHGAQIKLEFPSVGATENIIFSAVLARGTTVIDNAAIEPEILDTIVFLRKMGAKITVCKKRRIIIEGVKELGGPNHHTIPDRIEAASFATLALATNGRITVKNAIKDHLTTFIDAFCKIGGGYTVERDGITFFRSSEKLSPIHIETAVHPGFMTDWQQPLVVLLTQAEGESAVHETVYENRLGYTKDLKNMGANIDLVTSCLDSPCRFFNRDFLHSCIIKGPTKLAPTTIEIPDLRAGFAHIIAALIADGTSTICGVSRLERGYADIPGKLKSIGASIEVLNSRN